MGSFYNHGENVRLFSFEQIKVQKTCNKQLESCGLAVEHLAHNRKIVGSIPVQSNAGNGVKAMRARLMIAGAWSSSLMLQMIDNQSCGGK